MPNITTGCTCNTGSLFNISQRSSYLYKRSSYLYMYMKTASSLSFPQRSKGKNKTWVLKCVSMTYEQQCHLLWVADSSLRARYAQSCSNAHLLWVLLRPQFSRKRETSLGSLVMLTVTSENKTQQPRLLTLYSRFIVQTQFWPGPTHEHGVTVPSLT